MLADESLLSQATHIGSLASSIAVLGLLLNQHKIWIRLKDRVNDMWKDYCDAHDIPYTKIDNGH
jgi:hypothetical protein